MDYRVAVTMSYLLGVTFHFLTINSSRSRTKSCGAVTELFRYAIVAALNYVVTMIIVLLTVEKLHRPPYLGVLIQFRDRNRGLSAFETLDFRSHWKRGMRLEVPITSCGRCVLSWTKDNCNSRCFLSRLARELPKLRITLLRARQSYRAGGLASL